jgi:hypothetical protein
MCPAVVCYCLFLAVMRLAVVCYCLFLIVMCRLSFVIVCCCLSCVSCRSLLFVAECHVSAVVCYCFFANRCVLVVDYFCRLSLKILTVGAQL